jgi:CRISPR-associated endoribonuclease Cas6
MIIYYSVYRLELLPEERILLPPYKGSTLRGAFGTVFKRIVCALKNKNCEECMLSGRCVYAYVFESKPQERIHIFGRVNTIPRPFVIEPPEGEKTEFSPGERIDFALLLVGRASEYLPYFVYTFEELGNWGIGKGRGRYKLLQVKVPEGRKVYNSKTRTITPTVPSQIDLGGAVQYCIDGINSATSSQRVTLRFKTPTRIKFNRRLVIDPQFHILIRQLLRRLFLLWHFHCRGSDSAEELKDHHKEVIQYSYKVKLLSSSLRWYDWERYSHRQKTKIRLGGFIGEVTYEGPVAPFLPLLRAGEVLHIGKSTTFGLGKYEILD